MNHDTKLEVETVALDQLHCDPANTRSHDDRNLRAIADSLNRFGQQKPIVVDGAGRILAGNGTYEAARRLEWTEIHVVRTELEGIDATAYAIADNRTSDLSEFDETALARLLEELRAEDALVGVGFDEAEVDELLAGLREMPDPSEVNDPGPGEPPADPVSRTGDLWVLGDHRILCGDSGSAADIERLMDGQNAVLLASDPPYCVDYTGADRPENSGKDWSHVYREIDIEDLGEFLDRVFDACLTRLADNAGIYVWHAHLQQPVIAATFERHGLLLHQVLVWVKPTATFGHSYYSWRHEPCAFGWKRGHKPRYGDGKLTSVWEEDWEGKARIVGNEHPTQKPLRLFEIPMEVHTRPGDIVLEPFCGSGSQVVAAERIGRRCRAMEIQPAFVDVAVRRWELATGNSAVLVGDGRTFAQVETERRGG